MKAIKKIIAAASVLSLTAIMTASPVMAAANQKSFIIESSGETVAIPQSYSSLDAIERFDGGLGILSNPQDVCFDKNGNLYIVDMDNQRVLKTDADGKVIAVWCSYFPAEPTAEQQAEESEELEETEQGGETQTPSDPTAQEGNNNTSTSSNKKSPIPNIDKYKVDGVVPEGTLIPYTINENYKISIIYAELNAPEGAYVDNSGDIYICDTENRRILVYNEDYSVDRVFTQDTVQDPTKLGADYKFLPQKLAVSDTGLLYILNKSSYKGFFTLNAEGKFLSFVGSTKVESSVTEVLVQIFGSASQRNAVKNKQPPPATNLVIVDNMIYTTATTTTTTTDVKRIRKINVVGLDLFPGGTYSFSDYSISEKKTIETDFIDIAVDSNDIVTTLDKNLGYIVQYNQAGEMISAFGGIGNRKGQFLLPTSVAVNPINGYLYVSDGMKGSIQVFAPTEFINRVHEATVLYFDGMYNEALSIWENVLAMDETYTNAHAGVAEALYGYGKNVEAMEKFEYSWDYDGYDKAYADFRTSVFRTYFTPIVLSILSLIILFYVGFIKLKRKSDEYYK